MEDKDIRQFAELGTNFSFRLLIAFFALVPIFCIEGVFFKEGVDALLQGGFEGETQGHEWIIGDALHVTFPTGYDGLLHT